MGSVIPLKKEIDNSYAELKKLVKDKLDQVNQRIKYKLASEINLIHKITNYHLKSGGKKIRPLLTLGSAKLCGYTEGDRDVNLAACVELIHNATLLHDDVIDNSDLRRGIKTPNVIWGNQSSILVGDYLLSRCFEMMVEDGSQEVLKLLSSTSSKIAQGEVSQLEYKSEIDVLEETYFKIINSKTAALFAAATRVGACITNKNRKEKDALESYGRNLGLAFQIADDALDYYSTNKIFGKEIGKDFYEGKVTLPAIFLHQKANLSERIFLEKIFKKKNRSEKEFIQMQNLIKKYDSISDCFKRAEHFVNISYNALNTFNPSKEKSILQNLTSFSLERSF
ncbi:MAG: polyprenyl synthetase family protein [Alphaproteobacteria bacterium]|jgi:octaprenyl-diphosphate synthase|nr:polyprenyl synthetase family protein [Pelagibacterales bacterium]RUA14696.1 MAG: polyprenyl synthetase family protein [Alphaproteobacteria bacterium]RUA14873.1 MAG: polyprenyl synthetase family protein [Alphaproteobacteria bacterium]RUA17121.1 MAG: polyprenyl synthetase family protein [Alphaproteobacteria bacterium]HIN07980.1 polyprenyl synthetase family protein [Pelagibacteraceae bacterium]|tara:strand:+ start:1057 stop:2070 length:1014 start_codon:yes stop_codon:yes gene_type:complete